MSENGRLPQSALAPITKAINGEQAYLRKDAAAAFNAMNAEAERKYHVTLRVSSARTAYRKLADQVYFWEYYGHNRNLAAVPGTSNHGWGLAVDLATQAMRKIVDEIGAKYGFSKKWSDAPSEWWHIRWSPEHVSAEGKRLIAEHGNPWTGFTKNEKRLIQEYDRLFKAKKGLVRRRLIRAAFTSQRKKIWHLAQPLAKGGDGKGWSYANRERRYAELRKRS